VHIFFLHPPHQKKPLQKSHEDKKNPNTQKEDVLASKTGRKLYIYTFLIPLLPIKTEGISVFKLASHRVRLNRKKISILLEGEEAGQTQDRAAQTIDSKLFQWVVNKNQQPHLL